PRPFVTYIVGFHAGLPREFVLDAKVPVLNVGQFLKPWTVVRDVLPIQQRWIGVGQRLAKGRIRAVPAVDRILCKSACSQDNGIRTIEPRGVGPIKSIADRGTEIDSVAASYH